jgi:hypothetical protein
MLKKILKNKIKKFFIQSKQNEKNNPLKKTNKHKNSKFEKKKQNYFGFYKKTLKKKKTIKNYNKEKKHINQKNFEKDKKKGYKKIK